MSKKKAAERPCLYVPMYKFYLSLFHCHKDAQKQYGRFRFQDSGAAAFTLASSGNFGVYIPKYGSKQCKFTNKADYIAALAHEALHLVHYVFAYLKQERHGDEQDTYLLEHLLTWLINQTGVLEFKEKDNVKAK